MVEDFTERVVEARRQNILIHHFHHHHRHRHHRRRRRNPPLPHFDKFQAISCLRQGKSTKDED